MRPKEQRASHSASIWWMNISPNIINPGMCTSLVVSKRKSLSSALLFPHFLFRQKLKIIGVGRCQPQSNSGSLRLSLKGDDLCCLSSRSDSFCHHHTSTMWRHILHILKSAHAGLELSKTFPRKVNTENTVNSWYKRAHNNGDVCSYDSKEGPR